MCLHHVLFFPCCHPAGTTIKSCTTDTINFDTFGVSCRPCPSGSISTTSSELTGNIKCEECDAAAIDAVLSGENTLMYPTDTTTPDDFETALTKLLGPREGINEYICPIGGCLYSHGDKRTFTNHIRRLHPAAHPCYVACCQDSRDFGDREGLTVHLKSAHGIMGCMRLNCGMCPLWFVTVARLEEHRVNMHNIKQLEKNVKSSLSVLEAINASEQKLGNIGQDEYLGSIRQEGRSENNGIQEELKADILYSSLDPQFLIGHEAGDQQISERKPAEVPDGLIPDIKLELRINTETRQTPETSSTIRIKPIFQPNPPFTMTPDPITHLFPCPLTNCPILSPTHEHLLVHLESHNISTALYPRSECNACRMFTDQVDLIEHHKKAHNIFYTVPLACKLCAQVCFSTLEMERHQYKVHGLVGGAMMGGMMEKGVMQGDF